MKSVLKSKVLWFNVVTVLVVVLKNFAGYQPSDVVSANVTAVLSDPVFIAIVNFALRFLTKQPLSLAPQK